MRNSEARKRQEAATEAFLGKPVIPVCNLELNAQDCRNLLLLVEHEMLTPNIAGRSGGLGWLSSMFFRLQLADEAIERETYPEEFV